MSVTPEWLRANWAGDPEILEGILCSSDKPGLTHRVHAVIDQIKREQQPKPNKYHAIITEYDGVKYRSKAEALRAARLDILKSQGSVSWWIPAVRVHLGPARISYRMDFLVATHHHGRPNAVEIHGEEVKGLALERWKVIHGLWQAHGPFPLHVWHKGKLTEVVEPRKAR